MEHDLELILQVWKELKSHLIGGDVEDAADDFVHVLMEHGISPNEILKYGVDRDLKHALHGLADEEELELHEDEEFDDDDWGNNDYDDGC